MEYWWGWWQNATHFQILSFLVIYTKINVVTIYPTSIAKCIFSVIIFV